MNAEGFHTEQEWLDLVACYDGLCGYCRSSEALSRDHKTPLSRGGSDYIENILPACQSCNSRKGTKTFREFMSTEHAPSDS